MAALPSLPLLYPQPLLNRSALELANNMIKESASHDNTGKTFEQRMEEAHAKGCAEENVFKGTASPLEMVIGLLIDYGNKSLQHRENLLNPLVNYTGIAIKNYGASEKILVQDMTCQ